MMSRERIEGRATNRTAGTTAIRKRTAASSNGGISSSAHRIGTKLKPQTVTTASTTIRSRAVNACFMNGREIAEVEVAKRWSKLSSELRVEDQGKRPAIRRSSKALT